MRYSNIYMRNLDWYRGYLQVLMLNFTHISKIFTNTKFFM